MWEDNLTFAIGDVHGRLDLLIHLLAGIADHAGGRPHKIVLLGDYIDRGPDSAGVVETLRRLQRERPEEVVCLRGNHEAMLLGVIADPGNIDWWLDNGGDAAMASWEADHLSDIPADVIAWMRELPTQREDRWRIFVHAGLRPGVPLKQQREQDRLWIRNPFLEVDYDFGKHVVHGHTPLTSAEPDVRPYRTNLDTGAVFGGPLTAGVFSDLKGPAIRFLRAKP